MVAGDPIMFDDPAPVKPLAPERETDDYPTLAAWYRGAFSWAEHYRKVVLAQCRELIRAQNALELAAERSPTDKPPKPLTEARIDDLARTHPLYLQFLETHLRGRADFEAAFLAQGGMGV